jgi:hypothetical protein
MRSVSSYPTYWPEFTGMVGIMKARGEQIKRVKAVISDPTAVHVNMLRGTIATPTAAQLLHVIGDSNLTKLFDERDTLKVTVMSLTDQLATAQAERDEATHIAFQSGVMVKELSDKRDRLKAALEEIKALNTDGACTGYRAYRIAATALEEK